MKPTAAELAALGLAFFAGWVLVLISTFLAGYAAAFSFSRETLSGLGGHSGLFGLLLARCVQIPTALVAGALFWLLFKILGRSSLWLVTAASLPWVGMYVQGYAPHVVQNVYVAVAGLVGITLIPGAIYLAACLSRRPYAP